MSVSILFSALLALILTPALCATILKPIDGHHQKKGFFAWFDRTFDKVTTKYEMILVKVIKHSIPMMIAFVVITGLTFAGMKYWPTAFMPEEDQGWFLTTFQLPSDATRERTQNIVQDFEGNLSGKSDIKNNISILGWGFGGAGQNVGVSFTTLKDFDERTTPSSEYANSLNTVMAKSGEGSVMSILPPPIDELGTYSGFSLRLQDKANLGMPALIKAKEQLLEMAAKNEKFYMVWAEGLPEGNSVSLKIDREKLNTLGVNFAAVSDIISTSMGSMYINDFPNQGRMQQVIVQVDAKSRMQLDDILNLKVAGASGQLVSLSEVVSPQWSKAPQQYNRYNGRPSLSIAGIPNIGTSSGDAMREMEQLVAKLPKGIGYEWTGISLQEKQSESQIAFLLALSMLVIFLVLAALYESWAIPLSVMLVVPLGIFGAVVAIMSRGMMNDVFFKIGLITIIGLSAKNAILIVEFAKMLREEGMSLIEATVQASKLRLRPILMTSLAFTCGVVPLVIASGASSETQHALGTGVFGGMISATILAIFFVPVFFIFVLGTVEKLFSSKKKTSS